MQIGVIRDPIKRKKLRVSRRVGEEDEIDSLLTEKLAKKPSKSELRRLLKESKSADGDAIKPLEKMMEKTSSLKEKKLPYYLTKPYPFNIPPR